MENEYARPQMEVIVFLETDIVKTSSESFGVPGNIGDEWE